MGGCLPVLVVRGFHETDAGGPSCAWNCRTGSGGGTRRSWRRRWRSCTASSRRSSPRTAPRPSSSSRRCVSLFEKHTLTWDVSICPLHPTPTALLTPPPHTPMTLHSFLPSLLHSTGGQDPPLRLHAEAGEGGLPARPAHAGGQLLSGGGLHQAGVPGLHGGRHALGQGQWSRARCKGQWRVGISCFEPKVY